MCIELNRDVAQLVECRLWEANVACSNQVIPTNFSASTTPQQETKHTMLTQDTGVENDEWMTLHPTYLGPVFLHRIDFDNNVLPSFNFLDNSKIELRFVNKISMGIPQIGFVGILLMNDKIIDVCFEIIFTSGEHHPIVKFRETTKTLQFNFAEETPAEVERLLLETLVALELVDSEHRVTDKLSNLIT